MINDIHDINKYRYGCIFNHSLYVQIAQMKEGLMLMLMMILMRRRRRKMRNRKWMKGKI